MERIISRLARRESSFTGDLPNLVNLFGSKFWYKNGLCHRDGNKPSIIWSFGSIEWHKNGKYYKDFNLKKLFGWKIY
jgi:hypothetical protein